MISMSILNSSALMYKNIRYNFVTCFSQCQTDVLTIFCECVLKMKERTWKLAEKYVMDLLLKIFDKETR